jgi:hypothetical protein
MPKRSNQFQKIVTYIAEQLAPLGATVKESVELPEKDVNRVSREVDTLIEVGAGQTCVRIAVESRDRGRRDDIEWVDSLIGKYVGLPVDQVVAVSNAGFSATAKLKAKAYNIEVLSPQEVADTDWPARFQKLGIASLISRLDLVRIKFDTTPPFLWTVSLEDRLVRDDGDGNSVDGTVKEFAEEVLPAVMAEVRRYISENFLRIYKTLEDLTKTAIAERSLPGHGFSLVVGTSRYQINNVTLHIVMRNERTIVSVEHRVLGDDAMLSSGHVGEIDMVIAQTAGASEGKVFLQPMTTRKRRRKRGAS